MKDDIETYLRKSGYPPGLAKELKKALDKGTDILDSNHLPKTWKLCMQYNISLDQFATLPMHLLFLGIEKNLLSQTPIIFDCKKWKEAKSWKKLTDRMQRLQKAFDKLSLVWCMSRPFTGPKNIGTANWQSEHCVMFSRTSLIFFPHLKRNMGNQTHVPKLCLMRSDLFAFFGSV